MEKDWRVIEDIVAKAIGSQDAPPPFIKLTISNPIKKASAYYKIMLMPKRDSGKAYYQFALYYETKVRHENVHTPEDAVQRLMALLHEGYKQCDIMESEGITKILMNKKGHYKILTQPKQTQNDEPASLEHNRDKKTIIKEKTPVEYLVRLGIMGKDGSVHAQKRKKFKQINRYLEMVADVVDYLPEEPHILDMGCGKGYLTFALYDFLRGMGRKPRITGLDLKEDVMEHCDAIAADLGYDGLRFVTGDAAKFEADGQRMDMVVSLHACDTATDYALCAAVQMESTVIIAAPCCHHELYDQVENGLLSPLLTHGILKERFAALLTDSVRALILECFGYKCQVMEFVEWEHTPKNIMLRAIRKERFHREKSKIALRALMQAFQIKPMLHKLLGDMLADENESITELDRPGFDRSEMAD